MNKLPRKLAALTADMLVAVNGAILVDDEL
jgi:hypothetical protein